MTGGQELSSHGDKHVERQGDPRGAEDCCWRQAEYRQRRRRVNPSICCPDASGWWRLRHRIDGRGNRLSLGNHPKVGLSDAHRRRDEARKLIAAGHRPRARRARPTAPNETDGRGPQQLADAGLPGPGTFEAVARDWLATVHGHNVSAGHAERTRVRFEQDAFRWVGRRSIAEINGSTHPSCC